jgi:hypothetical protein
VVLLSGCSALTSTTPEQAEGLKEAQRIADQVTKAYGIPRVRVYAAAPSAQLRRGLQLPVRLDLHPSPDAHRERVLDRDQS